MFNSPSLSIPQAAELLGVTYRSAQQNVERLVKAGILREVTGRKRNRVFICDGIVAAVEGSDAPPRKE